MMATRWRYFGDVHLSEGGVFLRIEPDGLANNYADAVRVTPCSDAGGPDNMWWVEALTVLLPEQKDPDFARVLDSCGMTKVPGGSALQRAYALAEMCVQYGRYDPANCFPNASSETVQIGAISAFDKERKEEIRATVVLHGNASLRKYVNTFMERV